MRNCLQRPDESSLREAKTQTFVQIPLTEPLTEMIYYGQLKPEGIFPIQERELQPDHIEFPSKQKDFLFVRSPVHPQEILLRDREWPRVLSREWVFSAFLAPEADRMNDGGGLWENSADQFQEKLAERHQGFVRRLRERVKRQTSQCHPRSRR